MLVEISEIIYNDLKRIKALYGQVFPGTLRKNEELK